MEGGKTRVSTVEGWVAGWREVQRKQGGLVVGWVGGRQSPPFKEHHLRSTVYG